MESIDTELLYPQMNLFSAPWNLNFIKTVELLERNVQPEALIGFANAPSKEVVRFRGVPSLGFPAADIHSCRRSRGGCIELEVNFMGLYGPSSPLPTYFTEAIIQEDVSCETQETHIYYLSNSSHIREFQKHCVNIIEREAEVPNIRSAIKSGDLEVSRLTDHQIDLLRLTGNLSEIIEPEKIQAFKENRLVIEVFEREASRQRDFLDLFNHRLISLFYRASKKYQSHRDYKVDGSDAYSEKLYALIGAPDYGQRVNSVLNWSKLLRFIGLLSMKQATTERLVKVLSGYFGLADVRVQEMVFRWVSIPIDQQYRLGISGCTLGDDCLLGTKIGDRRGKLKVILRRLDFTMFKSFLPPVDSSSKFGEQYHALKELINFIKPSELLCELELELSSEKVPKLHLGFQNESECRLGKSTWLGECNGLSPSVVVATI